MIQQNRKKINEVFPDWLTSGVFTLLNVYDVPWKNDVDVSSLDIEYHGNISGDKFISPLCSKFVNDSGVIPAADQAKIAKAIFDVNNKNWSKLYATLELEYDPIENYRMEENGTDNSNTHNVSDGTSNNHVSATDNTTSSLWAFNSSTDVNSDKEISSNSTTGSQADHDVSDETLASAHHLERSGNIGVTTSQQMIESERDLWRYNFFRETVFPDIDKMLTLPIY